MRKSSWMVGTCVVSIFSLLYATVASSRPFRGDVGWSVLLCKFSDSSTPPQAADYYRDMFMTPGAEGLADYWRDISSGGLTMKGSVVKGWYTEPLTTAQATAKSGGPNPQRGELITDCINAARNSPTDPYTVPPGHRVAVITFPDVDLFGGGGGALLPSTINLGGMGHEVGHGLGLNHSFSDDPTYQNAPWSQIGEYDDPWDLMSYGNVFERETARFGAGGPGLNGYHADRMGWLQRSRIHTVGADGTESQSITLSDLNGTMGSGPHLVRIPFDPADVFHYYTVEFRRKDGWDSGFSGSMLLIHEVKPGGDGQYYSYLLRERGGARAPIQSLNANGVTMSVGAMSPDAATITVTTNIVQRCLQGYVWREANATDHVCVTPAIRMQTRDDNAQADARRNPNGGPFGRDTCLQGFVWREAFPNDHVCVTPQVRTQAAADNGEVSNRRNPARFVYGPNTCKQGFVWREADERDWVCVTPAVRSQVRQDNAQAPARWTPGPFGPRTCVQGFVWREAFPGDLVCVVPQTRTEARQDNREAQNRLLKP